MKNQFNHLLTLSSASFLGIFGLFMTASSAKALTFVLDFIEDGQGFTGVLENPNESEDVSLDVIGNVLDDFDLASFGFQNTEENFNLLTGEILSKVQSHFGAIPLDDSSSINFEIGDIRTVPRNGDSEYYYMQLGSYEGQYDFNTNTMKEDQDETVTEPTVENPAGTTGQAAVGVARNSTGTSNPFGLSQTALDNFAVGSVFTDHIDIIFNSSVSGGSSTLDNIVNAITNTLSHEIGHTLSLRHVYQEDSVTPTGVPPLMGTGALDLTGNDVLGNLEFSTFAYGEASSSLSSSHVEVQGLGGTYEVDGLFINQLIENALPADFPDGLPEINNVAQLQNAIEGTAVPWEFSHSMGLLVVGSIWGTVFLSKKSHLTKKG